MESASLASDNDNESTNSECSILLRSESFEEEMRELQSFTKLEAQCELEEEVARLRKENDLILANYNSLIELHYDYQTQCRYTYLPAIQETDELESSSPEVPYQVEVGDTESILSDCNKNCDNMNLNDSTIHSCDSSVEVDVNVEYDHVYTAVKDINENLTFLQEVLNGLNDSEWKLSPVLKKLNKIMNDCSQFSTNLIVNDLQKNFKNLSLFVESLISKQQDAFIKFNSYLKECLENNPVFTVRVEELQKELAQLLNGDLNFKVITTDISSKIEQINKENDNLKEQAVLWNTVIELLTDETDQSNKILDRIEKTLYSLQQLMNILKEIINIMGADGQNNGENALSDIFCNEKLQNSFVRIFSLVQFIDLKFKSLKSHQLKSDQNFSILRAFWFKCCNCNSNNYVNEKKEIVANIKKEFKQESENLSCEVEKYKNKCNMLTNQIISLEKSVKTHEDKVNVLLKENCELNSKIVNLNRNFFEQTTEINKLQTLLSKTQLSLESKLIEETTEKSQINQKYIAALQEIQNLNGELKTKDKYLAKKEEQWSINKQELSENIELHLKKIQILENEIAKTKSLSKKPLQLETKKDDEIEIANETIHKLRKQLEDVTAENNIQICEVKNLKLKLKRIMKLKRIFSMKSEAFGCLLVDAKQLCEDDVENIDRELQHLENQFQGKCEPEFLFVVKLLQMFTYVKNALKQTHKKETSTHLEKINSLQLQLANQNDINRKTNEENEIKLSFYKKRLSDLEIKHKQFWINGAGDPFAPEASQNIWKMKRCADHDRRRSLGPGIYNLPLISIENSEKDANKDKNCSKNGNYVQQFKKDEITARSRNKQSTVKKMDKVEDLTTENTPVLKQNEQIYKEKYNFAKAVARSRLQEINELKLVVEKLHQQIKKQKP